MPLVVKDRVQETSTTTGTGALTLSGALSGFQTFSGAIGNTNTTYYTIQNDNEWEVGIGTVGAGTLTRDTVLESSSGGSLVNFSAGIKSVFCTYPAEKSVDIDTPQTLSNKTLTGSALNGTVGATTPAAGTFTSLSDSGNLTFTGTGNRIIGDFSNATAANRVAFQTSTTNGNTIIYAIPNGTGAISNYSVANNSDVANASIGNITVNSSEVQLTSTRLGSGTFLPLTMYTGGSERMRIDSSGNVGIGTSSPTASARLHVNTANLSPEIALGNFGVAKSFWLHDDVGTYGGGANFGTKDAASVGFITNNLKRVSIDSSGNVGIGTASPSARLEIRQDRAENSFFDYVNATTGGGVVWRQIVRNIANSGTTSVDLAKLNGGAFVINNNDTNAANFTSFGVGASERMRIDSSGNVGIGTSSPSFRLDVAGNGRIGNVYGTGLTIAQAGNSITYPTDNTLAFNTLSTERMRIDSSGNLLVGQTGTSAGADGRLSVTTTGAVSGSFKNDAGAAQYTTVVYNAGTSGDNLFTLFGTEGTFTGRGSITYNRGAGLVAYNTTSDQRLKENIVDASSALSKIDSVKIRSFDWKETGNHVDFGVIAQELIEVAPECVTEGQDNEDGTIKNAWSVDTSALVPALVKAIQELSAKVDTLQAELNTLKGN